MLIFIDEAAAGSVTLRLGDEVRVTLTHMHCGTFASDGAIGIECFIATSHHGEFIPGTYGVDLTPRRASMFRVVSARQVRDVVTRVQPEIGSNKFPRAMRLLRRIFTVRVGDRLILGGTDIVCGVGENRRGAAIGCNHVDGAFDVIPRSWGMLFDPKIAVIFRATGKGDQMSAVVVRQQP